MRVPDTADRDFTASAYVVRADQVLLVDHAKLDGWLQPGGHVEARETPDETAVREVTEETGFDVEIVDAADTGIETTKTETLPHPLTVNLHRIRPDHWHCDFAYLARVVDARGSGEDVRTRWFTTAELTDEAFDVDPETARTATTAISRFESIE